MAAYRHQLLQESFSISKFILFSFNIIIILMMKCQLDNCGAFPRVWSSFRSRCGVSCHLTPTWRTVKLCWRLVLSPSNDTPPTNNYRLVSYKRHLCECVSTARTARIPPTKQTPLHPATLGWLENTATPRRYARSESRSPFFSCRDLLIDRWIDLLCRSFLQRR